MAVFLEGVEAVTMACTLVIGLPTIALVLAARGRAVPVLVGSILATAVVMWARVGGRWTIDSDGLVVVPIAASIVVAFVLAWRSVSLPGLAAVGAGALGGAIAGWLWRPCVGEQFATVLNDTEAGSLTSLVPMTLYVTGALLPAVLVAALPHAWPAVRGRLDHRRVASVGVALGGLYAATVLSGRYDDLVGELFRISAT